MLMTTLRRVVLCAVAVLLTAVSGLALAPGAAAHSRLVSITPADGSTVTTVPDEVVLTFNEDVNKEFVKVVLTDGEGGPVTLAAPVVEGPVVTQALPAGLMAGDYKVTYRVVSKDSHPIAGSSHFIVAGNPQAPASTTPTTPTAVPASPSASPSASMASPDPHPSASASMASPDPHPSATPATTGGDGDGIPAWVWLALGALVVLGIAAALASRGRNAAAREGHDPRA